MDFERGKIEDYLEEFESRANEILNQEGLSFVQASLLIEDELIDFKRMLRGLRQEITES